jgi:hypothetical protein
VLVNGKAHKRTHLGIRRIAKRSAAAPAQLEEGKPITAAPPRQGKAFVAPVGDREDNNHLEKSQGCYRTYTPPENES